MLHDVAGSGAARQRHFRRQVADFHEAWRSFFEPRVLRGTSLTAADYDAFPRFRFEDEPLPSIVARIGGPLLILLGAAFTAGFLGLRRYRRFSMAD